MISLGVFQGGNSWGGWGGTTAPQLLANNTLFGFSHNTDRKVASEMVLMGSFILLCPVKKKIVEL